MNVRPVIHRCGALLLGALLAGALLWCAPKSARPPGPATHAEAPSMGPPTVPVLTYRPHPEADAAARAQYDQIDAELKAHFDYDTGHQPVFASLEDLWGSPFFDASDKGWRAIVVERDAYEARIDHIIEAQPSPALTMLALARRGSLSDSMWRGLLTLEKRGFVLISSQRHAALVQAEGQGPDGPDAVQKTEMFIQEGFNRWRGSEMAELMQRAVAGYAWAAVIARRYGVAFDSVRRRLEFFRAQVTDLDGGEGFADMVYRAPPPARLAASYQRLVEGDLGLLPPTLPP